ncbi:MAG: gliding motility-associated C-terminal domain-containing protein, partial [Chitinophagales bacterium]
YLTVNFGDEELYLTWEENVPWLNETYTIFGRPNTINGVFDSITTVSMQNYTDTALINDSTYCYYIRSEGDYSVDGLISPIINFSQRTCQIPEDTIPPCAPLLSVANDCESFADQTWTEENFQNRLSWTVDDCASDVVVYRVYYNDFVSEDYILIAEINDTEYTHLLDTTLAGCYYVTAVDENDNESTDADTICIGNCPFYDLPNVFTPNGDGANDFYTPFDGWRFVERIEMEIYNRWGNKVFETQNPAINWDGTDISSGKDLEDGIYLYSGYYFVRQLDGSLQKIRLPQDEEGSGVIHLIRNR